MAIRRDWYVMSIVILFAGTLTFHRRAAMPMPMRCDAMWCEVMWSMRELHPPPTLIPLPPRRRLQLPIRRHTRHACSYTNSLRLITSSPSSMDGSLFPFWFCFFRWPRVTSTTMTRTFKICSSDPATVQQEEQRRAATSSDEMIENPFARLAHWNDATIYSMLANQLAREHSRRFSQQLFVPPGSRWTYSGGILLIYRYSF